MSAVYEERGFQDAIAGRPRAFCAAKDFERLSDVECGFDSSTGYVHLSAWTVGCAVPAEIGEPYVRGYEKGFATLPK